MAIKGDEFIVPISGQDLTARAFNSIKKNINSLKENFWTAQIAINQSFELMGKAARSTQKIFDVTIGGAIELEKNVAEVATLLGDNAVEATQSITKEILELQSQFGTGQADLAKAYYQAISSGAVDAESAQSLLTSAQKLAIGGVTSLTTATDGLTTILNSYGLEAENATDVSDVLFLGMKAGKTTIGELSQNLGLVASIASSTGVKFDELVASISAVTTGGVNTSVAVTQVRSAIVGLSKQTPQLTAILNKLGVTSIKTKIAQDGLVGTLKEIIAETDGSSEELIKLFGRIEAVNAVSALTSDAIGGKFNKTLNEMGEAAKESGKITEDAFKKIADTSAFQLQLASAQFDAEMTKIGMNLKSTFLSILGVAKTVASAVSVMVLSITEFFNNIDTEKLRSQFESLTISVTLLGSALALAFRAQIAQVITTMAASVAQLAVSFAAAAAPAVLVAVKAALIGGAITLAIGAVDLLVRNFELLKLKVNLIIAEIKQEFSDFADFASGFLSYIFNGESAQASVNETKESVSGMKSEVELAREALANTKKEMDFGLIGDGIKAITDLFGETKNQIADTSDKAKKLKNDLKEVKIEDDILPPLNQSTIDQLQKLTDMKKSFDIQQLEAEGRYVEAVKLRNTAALQAFDKEYESLKLILKGRDEELKKIEEARDALIAKGEADIGEAAGKEADAKTKKIEQSTIVGFNPGQIEQIQNVFGQGAANIADAIGGAGIAAAVPILGAVDMVANVIQGLIDLIPNLIKKIAGIFTSLTDLPNMLLDSLMTLLSSLDQFFSSFLTNLFTSLPKILMAVFVDLPRIISDGFLLMINQLPALIDGFIDAIPEMINQLVQNMPRLAISLISFLIKDAPRIAVALVKAMSIDLPKALVEGIVEGIASSLSLIRNMGKNIIPVDKIKDGISDISDKISRSSSQLFKVVDLEAASRGLDVADKIRNAINSSTTNTKNILSRMWDALKKIWDKVFGWFKTLFGPIIEKAWDYVKGIFTGLKETVEEAWDVVVSLFDGLKDIVTDAFDTIVNFFKLIFKGKIKEAFQGVLNFFKRTLSTVWQKAVEPIMNFFKNTFKRIWETAYKPIVDFFSNMGSKVFGPLKEHFINIFTEVKNLIMAPFNMIKDFFSNIFEGNITSAFDSVFNFFEDLPKNLMKGLEALNPANLFKKLFNTEGSKGQGSIEKAIGEIISGFDIPFVNFAEGGVVPGSPIVPGDSETNDIVPALLSPDEIVLSRSQVRMFKEMFPDTQNLFDGNIVDSLKSAGAVVSDGVKNVVKSLNPSEIMKKYKENVLDKLYSMIEKMFMSGASNSSIQEVSNVIQLSDFQQSMSALKLANGGMVDVPEGVVRNRVVNASNGAFIGENNGTDTVRTNLTPGEFVVNREATRNNLGLLSRMNETRKPVTGGDVVNNYNTTINAKTLLTPEQIKREVVPVMEREIKRKSQQGRYVIDRSGIRS